MGRERPHLLEVTHTRFVYLKHTPVLILNKRRTCKNYSFYYYLFKINQLNAIGGFRCLPAVGLRLSWPTAGR